MKKHKNINKPDSGIAIMFTLIMLSIFFLIAFGFVSFATSAKSAAKAREPKQSTSLTATESILNEALFAINKGLYASSEAADTGRFVDLDFSNGTRTATMSVWGTSNTSLDKVDLEDALVPQFIHSVDGELKPVTGHAGWSNFSWITSASGYKYAWMVIDSNGLDVNYLGDEDNYATAGNRQGKYIRELAIQSLGTPATFKAIYNDWSGNPPSNVWESKKDLINTMAAEYETAVEMLEVGTTPVKMMGRSTSQYNLSSITNATDVSTIVSGISWLSSSSASTALKNQIAANIKDYVDDDTYVSSDNSTYMGNERVPYINQVNFSFTNTTAEPTGGPPPTTATATSVSLEVTVELANLFGTATWGAVSGANGACIVNASIVGKRGSDTVINVSNEPYTINGSGAGVSLMNASSYFTISETFTVPATSSTESADIDMTVTINSVKLYPNYTEVADDKLWDATKSLGSSSEDSVDRNTTNACTFEVYDPRVNYESADWLNDWDISGGSIGGANTVAAFDGSGGTSSDYEPSAGHSAGVSTGYMPLNGGINLPEELGLISRGEKFKTLNLVDYNTQTPGAFDSGAFRPTATLDLANNLSNSNGGDRSILDYVWIGSTASYEQSGIINPNTSNEKILEMLFTNVSTLKSPTPLTTAEIDKLKSRFPSVKGLALTKMFMVDDFHDADTSYHNRNPKSYGYIFSRQHDDNVSATSNADQLSDAVAEAALHRTARLISPKYSYYTILVAVEESGVTTSVYAFVRRDNEGGSFKVIKTIEKVSP